MTDIRADEGSPLDREERLPWLEAVEEDDKGDGPSIVKLAVAVLIGLVAIGGIVSGIVWLSNRGTQTAANEELIKAPAGPYKVRPDDPGGMTVEGEGDTAFAASAGADPKGRINTSAVPEAPVTQSKGEAQQPPAQAQPPAAQVPATKGSPSSTPAATANAGPGGTIQLGAFPNAAAAEKAWKAMSGRFGYLAPLSHSVVAANVNGKTWYRLRASGAGAADVCGRLQVAGENCLRID